MTAFKITYTRADMPNPCGALKFAHSEKGAIGELLVGSVKNGYRIKKSGVPVDVISVMELD
tara:strand:+ start:207 stop:389 length:183 start_codon:yes stop_codon:yes gene_type:complete